MKKIHTLHDNFFLRKWQILFILFFFVWVYLKQKVYFKTVYTDCIKNGANIYATRIYVNTNQKIRIRIWSKRIFFKFTIIYFIFTF
jgi:hypothetical protein